MQREKCEPKPSYKHLSSRISILTILAKRRLGHTIWGEEETILGDFSTLG